MKHFSIKLGNKEVRRSDIRIAAGAMTHLSSYIKPWLDSKKVFVISDQRVGAFYGATVLRNLRRAGLQASCFPFPISEANKNMAMVERIHARLLRERIDRQASILALGGGVVGDVVGFAAATILRGVTFFQAPTSLLAQVDASIGGKVGVNFAGLKNMVGSFYQPRAVIIDPNVLKTLSQRHLLNGMAEVVKYGVIADPTLFRLLENMEGFSGLPMPFLTRAIERSVHCKSKIVSKDERESGVRAFLNFGHTLGHALEMEAKGRLYHGEAIILGMRFAAELSRQRGLCRDEVCERIKKTCEKYSRSSRNLRYNKANFASVWRRLSLDKKRKGDEIKMVLVRKVGQVGLFSVNKKEVEKLFNRPELWWR